MSAARISPPGPDPVRRPISMPLSCARRLAQERGIDIGRLTGSGPGGEILAADILAAAPDSESHRLDQTLSGGRYQCPFPVRGAAPSERCVQRSEEHTSELQSRLVISYA